MNATAQFLIVPDDWVVTYVELAECHVELMCRSGRQARDVIKENRNGAPPWHDANRIAAMYPRSTYLLSPIIPHVCETGQSDEFDLWSTYICEWYRCQTAQNSTANGSRIETTDLRPLTEDVPSCSSTPLATT